MCLFPYAAACMFFSAEKMESERLREQLDDLQVKHAAEISNYKANLSQLRFRYQERSASLKVLTKELQKTASELQRICVLREVEQERAHASIVELFDKATASAREEAGIMWQETLKQEKIIAARKLSEHKEQKKDVEKQLSKAQGDLIRLEASVISMLAETAQEVSARAAVTAAPTLRKQ